MDHLTPEEEKEFQDWIEEGGYSLWRDIYYLPHFSSGWGMKTKEELYAIFKSEKENKLKE